MRVVAIETATASSSVALGEGRNVVAAGMQQDARGHVRFLVPALDFCFASVGWSPDQVDVVAVDVGPGRFSGIRVGLATAQAIAGAVGAPLVPVSSLDAVALQAATGHRRVWAVVDVRRGEIAVGPYQPVPGGVVRDGPTEIVTPDVFRGMLDSDRSEILVVGDWASVPAETFSGLHAVKMGRPRYPEAGAVLEIAVARAEKGEFIHPDEIRPLYLREPDTRINWADYRTEGPWAS